MERPELGVELSRVEACPGGAPMEGREVEESLLRPVRQDPDEVAKVALGVELVEAGRRSARGRCGGRGAQ